MNIIGWGRTLLVTFSGLAIVFSVLILLVFVIKLFGIVFHKKEKPKRETKQPSDISKVSAEKSVNPKISALSVPQSGDSDIDGETLAVISAAVYAYMAPSGKKYQIKSITERQTRRRPAWATAGIMQNTRPF